MRVAVLLNGPPGSGKDTIADALFGMVDIAYEITSGIEVAKFADPLYGLCAAAFNPTYMWGEILEDRKRKETKSDEFFGLSPREAMIWFSEEVMKPKFGKDVFGKLALRSLGPDDPRYHDTYVFSDSGFPEEAKVIIDALGAENVLLVRLSRAGCNFDGDSRSYWVDEDTFGAEVLGIANNGTVEGAARPIAEWIETHYCAWKNRQA